MIENMKEVEKKLTAIWWSCQEVIDENSPALLDKILLDREARREKYKTAILYREIKGDVELAQQYVVECHPKKAKRQLEKLQTRFNEMVGGRAQTQEALLDAKVPMMVRVGKLLTESIGQIKR